MSEVKKLEVSVDEINSSIRNSFPKGGMTIKDSKYYGHLLKIPVEPNTAFREHNEPSGWIDSGTTFKNDFMLDPYEQSSMNYRIGNIFGKHFTDGAYYTNGAVCSSVKAAGEHNFGLYPVKQFGFQDCSSSATPMSLYYFDTSDTEWRYGQQGMWRSGKQVVENNFVIYGGKLYKTLQSGVCGDVPPTHTDGVESDGNIDIEFVREFNSDAIEPVVVIGNRDDLPKFGYPDVRLQLLQNTLIGYGKKIHFIDQNGVKISLQAGAYNSLNILNDDGDIVMTIDLNNERFDFRKKLLIREGIQDYTGSTGDAGQVLVANGDGTCEWKTL